jgi:hypothetical protein
VEGQYFEPPAEYTGDAASVFLAGGITGCPDWQELIARRLVGAGIVVINPRCRKFPTDDPAAAKRQIAWEFRHLRRATARAFWFPSATLCPIALFELGAWSNSPGPLFVGADPAYDRRLDVIEQLRLARPDVAVVNTPDKVADQVLAWAESGGVLS